MKGEIEAAVIHQIIENLKRIEVNEKTLNYIINKLIKEFKIKK
tara:strand:- start:589 stop:717 length:129 start_codon:yes stop_codon:yes gene_type:complete